jgi:serine/threonine protein kinase
MAEGIVLELIVGIVALVVGVIVVVMVAVPVCRAIGWVIRQVFHFVVGEIGDAFRFIGAILLGIVYIPLIVLNLVIGRWSACGHYGRAFQAEIGTMGMCLYRIALGHPLRLFAMQGLTEGLERRLPAVVKAAPTSDGPTGRTGQFEGYKIVGSLAGGGSGAKLYIAEPDPVKLAAFQREGLGRVGQVVIKSFSLQDGSSLPQIVRESRSLDAAKRLGLILDHELTPERFFYVMRFVPGQSLSLTTKQLHATSPQGGLGDGQLRAALGIECDLVSTLSTYHQGGLWHKDVKPDNIIIDGGSNPRAHLVDFGLVSSLRSAMTLTTHGTEYFRDPEMVRMALKGVKVHEVDGTRFDIYAAGAVLYSMIEDSFPAHGVLSNVTKRCPEAVKWIIRRAMTDYDKRYTSADAMLADLQAVAASADPFEIKPVDLPSMGGTFAPAGPAAPEEPVIVAAAATPVPPPEPQPAAGPQAGPIPGFSPGPGPADPRQGPRRAPRIRVANWWSGRTEVEPGQADAPRDFASMVGDIAERGVRNARAAVDAAMAGVQAGMARPGPVRHEPASQWRPREGPRARAAEQLTAARARVAAARERARARFGSRRPSFDGRANSGAKGIALGLFIFLGSCVFLGTMLLSQRAPTRGVAASGGQTYPTVIGGGSSRRTRHGQAAPEPLPSNVNARVLVINDVRRPWGEKVSGQVGNLISRFSASGITTVGEGPSDIAPDQDADVDLAATARLVLDGTQTPVDAREAPAKFAKWFEEKQPPVDAVVWIVQPVGSESAKFYVFAADPKAKKSDEIVRVAMYKPQ